jgi:hypothetical protein
VQRPAYDVAGASEAANAEGVEGPLMDELASAVFVLEPVGLGELDRDSVVVSF